MLTSTTLKAVLFALLGFSTTLADTRKGSGSATACPHAPFHPLASTPLGLGFFQIVDSSCVGVVKNSGALDPEPLNPGLHWRPWSYMGEKVYHLLQIPDTDEYDNIQTKTMNHIPYTFKVSVTNQVLPEDMVEVVKKMGINYDQGELKMIVHSAVREVVKSLAWMDIEKERANDLNELFMEKIKEDLVAKFGPVDGKRIKITMVTVMQAKCGNEQLMKELENQAMHDSRRQTEIAKRAAEAETFTTQQAAKQAELALAESTRKAQADREMQTAMAEAARRQVKNDQDVKDATAAAEATKIQAEARIKALDEEAQVYNNNPQYSQHLIGMEKANAIKGVDSKLVISAELLDSVTGAVGGAMGAAGVKAGFCKATGWGCSAAPAA